MSKPPHEPTDASRAIVQVLLGAGITQEKVAKAIGITDNTMRKYYEHEIENAKTMLDAEAVSALMKNIRNGREASIIFYLKARMGWKETQTVQLEGLPPVIINVDYGDGKPVPFDGVTLEHQPAASQLPAPAVREGSEPPVKV